MKSIHDAVKPDHMWLVLEVGDGAVLSVCGVNGERITKNYISCYMWLVLGVGVGVGVGGGGMSNVRCFINIVDIAMLANIE